MPILQRQSNFYSRSETFHFPLAFCTTPRSGLRPVWLVSRRYSFRRPTSGGAYTRLLISSETAIH
jgi:hypothetical protein